MQKQPSKGLFKKGLVRSFAEFTTKYFCRNPLFGVSSESCEICKNTYLAEQHRTTASDYTSINSGGGSIVKQDWKL